MEVQEISQKFMLRLVSGRNKPYWRSRGSHKCVYENAHSSTAIEKRTHVDRELFWSTRRRLQQCP